MIVTASLTTGVARVANGMPAALQLVDLVFRTDHSEWETTMYVGDVEFHRTEDGPYPSHQLRISVRPATGYAALNYIDHDDPHMTIANSFNPQQPPPEVRLIFNGTSGSVFPLSAAIPIGHARAAVIEWLQTRKRPTCIAWQSFDNY
jgi:Immunity protein Imm1